MSGVTVLNLVVMELSSDPEDVLEKVVRFRASLVTLRTVILNPISEVIIAITPITT